MSHTNLEPRAESPRAAQARDAGPEVTRRARLAQIDADVSALDLAVRSSRVDRTFRRAWHDFVANWRTFYFGEKDHPSASSVHGAALFAGELRGWRASFKQAVAHGADGGDGMGAFTFAAGGITPGAIRFEWELGRAEVERLAAQIAASSLREAFLRAWVFYVAQWRRAYADSLALNAVAGIAGWRQARAYRRRNRAWRQALMREQPPSSTGVGALFVTPGAIKDEIETVDAAVKQLGEEIASSAVRQAFKQSWRLFVDEWRRFYASKQGLWGRTWGSTMEKVAEYRKRIDEWRAAFVREGGQSATPNLNVPEPRPAGGVPWLLVGGLLLGGAVLGAKALR